MAMVLKLGVVLGSASQRGEAQKLAIGSKSRCKQQQQQQPKSVFCGLRRRQQQQRLAVVRASGDNVEVQVKELEEVETMEELTDILPSGEWPENFSLLNFEDLSKHYEPILFKLEVCHGLQTTFWVLFLFSRGLGYTISFVQETELFSVSYKQERKKDRESVKFHSLWSVICVLVSSFLRCSWPMLESQTSGIYFYGSLWSSTSMLSHAMWYSSSSSSSSSSAMWISSQVLWYLVILGRNPTSWGACIQAQPSKYLADVMSRIIATASPHQLLEDVHHHFTDISGLPVIDHEYKCVGVLSKKDVKNSAAGLKALVCNVMSTPAITLSVEKTVSDAAVLMLKNKIHRIPIVNESNQVVGIVTRTDIFTAMETSE
jgi:CBS domain-containing protein